MKMEEIKDIAIPVAFDLAKHINNTNVKVDFKGVSFSVKDFEWLKGNDYETLLFKLKDENLIINIAMLIDRFSYNLLVFVVDDILEKVTKTALNEHGEREISKRMMEYFDYKYR